MLGSHSLYATIPHAAFLLRRHSLRRGSYLGLVIPLFSLLRRIQLIDSMRVATSNTGCLSSATPLENARCFENKSPKLPVGSGLDARMNGRSTNSRSPTHYTSNRSD